MYLNQPNSKYYSEKKKFRLGALKDELKGQKCLEYVASAKKQYSSLLEGEAASQYSRGKSKGLPYHCLKNVTFETYKKIFFSSKISKKQYTALRSKQHQVYQMKFDCISFSPVNFSRFLLGQYGIHSLPFGYKNTRADGIS